MGSPAGLMGPPFIAYGPGLWQCRFEARANGPSPTGNVPWLPRGCSTFDGSPFVRFEAPCRGPDTERFRESIAINQPARPSPGYCRSNAVPSSVRTSLSSRIAVRRLLMRWTNSAAPVRSPGSSDGVPNLRWTSISSPILSSVSLVRARRSPFDCLSAAGSPPESGVMRIVRPGTTK